MMRRRRLPLSEAKESPPLLGLLSGFAKSHMLRGEGQFCLALSSPVMVWSENNYLFVHVKQNYPLILFVWM